MYFNSTIYQVFFILISFFLLGAAAQGVIAQGEDVLQLQEGAILCSALPSQEEADLCYADMCLDSADAACAERIVKSLALFDAEFATVVLLQLVHGSSSLSGLSGPLLAQTIGSTAFENADSTRLGDSFLSCAPEFYRGCHFGFFKAAIDDDSTLTDTAASLCGTVSDTTLQGECHQLIGHMVMKYTDYTLDTALSACDAMAPPSRTSCYEGVFLENSTPFFIPEEAGIVGDGFLADDPLAPCNAVAEQHQESCYKHHGQYLIHLFHGRYPDLADLCVDAGIYESTCRQSIAAAYAAVDDTEAPLSERTYTVWDSFNLRSWWQKIIDSIVGLFLGLFGG